MSLPEAASSSTFRPRNHRGAYHRHPELARDSGSEARRFVRAPSFTSLPERSSDTALEQRELPGPARAISRSDSCRFCGQDYSRVVG